MFHSNDVILQEEYYKELYEKECSRHRETQEFLQSIKSELEKTRTQLGLKIEEYEKKIKTLQAEVGKCLCNNYLKKKFFFMHLINSTL